ncbi:sigma-70 family RNA polymerase sigma factor [Reichenbachiella sp. MALMAid0571]|uniref:RNA polymerase sigma factor n=1 Tax=Reichenbachiella sp. MALMAid0571 TaxID=3143939 RepID=UPI0032DF0509
MTIFHKYEHKSSGIKEDTFMENRPDQNDHKGMLKNLSDQHLWLEFLNGSDSAFAQIYARFFSLLFNYGIKIDPNRQLINDCIQDLFIDIWNSRTKLGEVEWLKTYLIKSLRRRILKESNKESFLYSGSVNVDYNFQVVLSHDMQLIREEDIVFQNDRLKEALNKLTYRQREAIFLKFYERLSYEQIADVMSITVKATYKVMARAIDVLKKAFY